MKTNCVFSNTGSKIYCSTGAFIGRVNGRNHRLVVEYGGQINCDGFELMIFADWYERMNTVIHDLKTSGLSFPVVHADKATGDLLSASNERSSEECFELFRRNCSAAAEIGSKAIVLHIWGVPDSDRHVDRILEDCGTLLEIADSYGLDMLAENCACINADPLTHFLRMVKMYPNCGFTIDTRPAAFHGQLEDICRSAFLWENGHIRHIHISDYKGGLKDWKALYPIPQPGKGDIDFGMFFSYLNAYGYTGSITLEAPSMLPDSVDVETFNSSIDFIRRGLGQGQHERSCG